MEEQSVGMDGPDARDLKRMFEATSNWLAAADVTQAALAKSTQSASSLMSSLGSPDVVAGGENKPGGY